MLNLVRYVSLLAIVKRFLTWVPKPILEAEKKSRSRNAYFSSHPFRGVQAHPFPRLAGLRGRGFPVSQSPRQSSGFPVPAYGWDAQFLDFLDLEIIPHLSIGNRLLPKFN
jgi:hypothetical protein